MNNWRYKGQVQYTPNLFNLFWRFPFKPETTYAQQWDQHSSGMLWSTDWQLVTEVSGQPLSPKMSVTNQQWTLHDIPEEQRSHLHHDRNF